MCYCGDLEEGERATEHLRSIGTPIVDVVAPTPFTSWQQAFDPLLAPGARNYWKSHDFTELSDESIDVLTKAIGRLPGPECEVFIGHVGGAAGRIASDATAFPQRSSHYVMNVHARWREIRMDQPCMDWARGLFEATRPYAAGTAYINFMPQDETDRTEAAYGSNYQRLVEVKRKYDPLNLFRMIQNIRPAVEIKAAYPAAESRPRLAVCVGADTPCADLHMTGRRGRGQVAALMPSQEEHVPASGRCRVT